MRRTTLAVIVVLLAGSFVFAGRKIDKKEKGIAWLNGFTQAPEANINGSWSSKSWGIIKLEQQEGQANLTGKGDGWIITGKVCAKKAYLLFSYKNGNIAYSAILEQLSIDSWAGEYWDGLQDFKRGKMDLNRASEKSKKH
jgi:hypothetical protein